MRNMISLLLKAFILFTEFGFIVNAVKTQTVTKWTKRILTDCLVMCLIVLRHVHGACAFAVRV